MHDLARILSGFVNVDLPFRVVVTLSVARFEIIARSHFQAVFAANVNVDSTSDSKHLHFQRYCRCR